MKNMIFYALITARAGSKGIRHKNLQKINKKSLVEISIKKIKKSRKIKKIFCSSDSNKILNICKKNKVETIKRPKNISGDKAKSFDVVFHFLNKIKEKKIVIPDVIFLIQPTSPFFDSNIINEIVSKYKKTPRANTINSFVKLHHKYSHINHCEINKKGMVNYLFYNKRKKNTLRQNKKTYYVHGNIFSFKTKAILKDKSLMPKPIYSVLLKNRYQAIDIDDQEDLKMSRMLINSKI